MGSVCAGRIKCVSNTPPRKPPCGGTKNASYATAGTIPMPCGRFLPKKRSISRHSAPVRPHESKKSRGCRYLRRQTGPHRPRWDFVVHGLSFAYTLRCSNWRSITPMASPQGDQFVMIKIEGMHCHRCEQSIKKSLGDIPGVHEVEVDFL